MLPSLHLGEINSGIHIGTSLPLNLYTSVFGCGCGFGFEQKFWWIDGFAYPYSPLSFNNIIFCPSNVENLMFWQFSLPVEFTHELKKKRFVVSVTLSL